jgi:hypothetical protein
MKLLRSITLLCALVTFPCLLKAQSSDTTVWKGGTKVERIRPPQGIVENVFFMPYVTGSMNLHSGQAFPKTANGTGYGFGVAFDLTKDGQKSGFYFDFAFQNMRAVAEDGICANDEIDTLLTSVRAEHHFQYVVFEPFLKLQGERANGYFLVGGSFGYAVQALTFKDGDVVDGTSNWQRQSFHNPFRFDLRAGLGLILANFGQQKLILEGRVGYPLTNAISDLVGICNDTGEPGDWRIISIQANVGVRF